MILYSAPASPFGRKVKLAAHCLGMADRISSGSYVSIWCTTRSMMPSASPAVSVSFSATCKLSCTLPTVALPPTETLTSHTTLAG